MKLIRYCFLVVIFSLMLMNVSESAAGSNCSYSKSVQQKGTAFDIISRPAYGCGVQIVTLTVRRGGRKIAVMKADVDYLAQSARAVDLTGDGSPELAVISRTTGGAATEALDVYWLDGTMLRRTTVPAPEDKSGYKGGDRFRIEGRQFVRTVPVYRDGDPAGKPTGGTRSLKYDFRDGALTLSTEGETAESGSDASTEQSAATPEPPPAAETEPPPAVETETPVPAPVALAITWISIADEGIEIRSNRTAVKYKTILLDKPERIAVDIPGADSFLAGKKVAINRFGISAMHVERRKGGLRFVMDMHNRTFESFGVKSSGNSVFITFIQ